MAVNRNTEFGPTLGTVTERRSYRQLCGLAAALDLVGERWTMLLVRDLGLGPRRYGELLDGLPGIGEGLLAQRLRHLEGAGIVAREFSARHNAVVYVLTDDGRELWEALIPLTAWGVRRIPDIDDHGTVRADWIAVALRSRLDPVESVGIDERYEMQVDGEPYTVTAADGEVLVERGEAPDAAVRIQLDFDTFMALGMGSASAADALAEGRMTIEGGRDAQRRWARLLRGIR